MLRPCANIFGSEVQISAMQCDAVRSLSEFFEDEKRYYLVTEICKGGELFDEILARGKFTERDGAVLMK